MLLNSPNRVGIRNSADYSPFGVELDGRTVSGGYRLGFQNQEKDDEVKGEGNSINYTFRMHDPRLGRWLSMDLLTEYFPETSPFVFVNNIPIWEIDPDGKVVVLYDYNGNKVATISKTETIIELGMENSEIIMQYNEAKNYIQDNAKNTIFLELENNDKILEIRFTENIKTVGVFKNSGYDITGESIFNNTTESWEIQTIQDAFYKNDLSIGQIQWNPKMGAVDFDGNNHSPALILLHELFHAKHFVENLKQFAIDKRNVSSSGEIMEEIKTMNECNEISKYLPNNDGGNGVDQIRTSHNGFKTFKAESTISNTNPDEWVRN
jgi:RHS repeat-associated protein